MQVKGKIGTKAIYIFSLLTMIGAMVIFLNSFYWPYQDISNRKIAVGIIVGVCIVVIPIVVCKNTFLSSCVRNVMEKCMYAGKKIRSNRKKILFGSLVIILGCFVAILVTGLLARFLFQTEFNLKLFYMIFALEMICFVMITNWKHAKQNTERLFLLIALIIGAFSISVTPNRVGVSWDDEVHYAKTLELSNVLNGIMYVADDKNIEEYATNIYAHQGYDRETSKEYQEDLQELYKQKEFRMHDFSNYGVWSVAYVPAAIGIIVARGLELSYVNVFNAGCIVNLICYSLLIYYAIKRIKHGKMLVALIGLLPTTIFMAASYSYDWWVTGFTILGFSYFFAEMQEDSPLRTKNLIIAVGAIAIGCLPKAIYFPILFPLLFIPRKKFCSKKQRMGYYLCVVGAGVLLVASFLLPMLIGGAGAGDVRGGSDVNSTEQILYIIQNPFEYARTLFVFLKEYISISSVGPMLQRFAYVGNGTFYGVVYAMIWVVAFLDRGDIGEKHFLIRGTSLVGCAVALVLSTTALYISFTAVGANTVAGMQGRYLIPFMLPTLYAVGQGGVQHKFDKNAFVCVPMLIMAITFIYNMFQMCVRIY